ncbi:PTS system mannose/fructose/sorbose family transporter subunit IID [Anaerorhabdus sp.]|uniref:PTS system mannose/fructose/sorbose family transporter subunit IID n=1 Tax=Anaerorhabdus sp. TaxID=1872524 RepID=UPI002B1E95D3|nr:PTS system mannose/fructose/sorbose family transporter subunit IID [Anaerorhabdus sp.]MEA4875887.1 PTS system mannose/fructose/sorbose family transporter subunit IID [Anaerorhabdus sp.]
MTNKITKKDVQKAAWTNVFFHHCAQNYERMMGLAFCHILSKPLKQLYPNKEDYIKALERHMNFYNTEPTLGSIIPGVILGLEEGMSNGEDVTEEMILGTKTALMGPFAGIGDSLIGATYASIVASIAIGLSSNGSLLGVFFFLIFHAAVPVFMKYGLFMKGYELGLNALNLITPKITEIVTTTLGVVGLITVGGITATTVKVPIAFEYVSGDLVINIQSILDQIMPGLLPLCLTIGLWWLYQRKGWSAIKALLVLLVIVIILVYLGVM